MDEWMNREPVSVGFVGTFPAEPSHWYCPRCGSRHRLNGEYIVPDPSLPALVCRTPDCGAKWRLEFHEVEPKP